MTHPSGKSSDTDRADPALSIVLPVRDERESLDELHTELVATLATLPLQSELVFVDDGSADDSLDVLRSIATRDPRVRVLSLNRRRGKSAAYMAGFAAARGRLIVTMDSDLQDDPAEIPRIIEPLADNADLVVGWKQGRMKNEPEKSLPSRVFNFLIGAMFGVHLHDINCGLRAMTREVARSLTLYGDYYRFLPLIAHAAGFRIAELPVAHRRRRHGASKYGPRRFWTGVLDLLSLRFELSFREKPLHLFGSLALALLLLGAGIEAHVLWRKLAGESFQSHIAAIVIGALSIMAGIQVLTTGLIGVMLARRPPWSTANVEELPSPHAGD